MDGRAVALRPIQLFALGVLAYGLVKRSWPAGVAGVAVLAYDVRRELARPEFEPLDLVASR